MEFKQPEFTGDEWSAHDLILQDLRNLLNFIIWCKLEKKSKEECIAIMKKETNSSTWTFEMIEEHW